jgi:Protein of unknown function (DUF3386)
MRGGRFLLLCIAVWLIGGAEARAHFLFIHIGPPAEAGRSAEVFFSEQAEAGDSKFVERIAQTQLWMQTSPGDFQPLTTTKATDRLRAHLPASGSVVVVGSCQYGVLARPKQVPFLLRYYPKAIAGRPDELNAMQPRRELPLEIMAKVESNCIRFVLLRDGKPAPGVEFTTVDADLNNEKVTAGPDGQATWTPPAPGRYSIYTQQNTKQSGEVSGTRYEEIREFPTLAFAWPLERRGADAEAVSMFEDALAARAQWKGFPGFSARITGEFDSRPFEGRVTIDAQGEVALEADDEISRAWVEGQLESIAMHRRAEGPGSPRPALHFADLRDDHPLGRLLMVEGGRFAASYRIKDRQITVVNRHVGRTNMTITTLDHERTPEGLFLPRSYVVQYWDDKTGSLVRTETVQDRWMRSGSFDLPATHTVTTASDEGFLTRTLTLSDHRLLEKK